MTRDEEPDNPIRVLLDALAHQADVLSEYLDRVYEEAFLETAPGPARLEFRVDPDRAYFVRRRADGSMTVSFGDGSRGRRPARGSRLKVSYRRGSGQVKAKVKLRRDITKSSGH
jgi:uncharacterized phage protein gp47/JayE